MQLSLLGSEVHSLFTLSLGPETLGQGGVWLVVWPSAHRVSYVLEGLWVNERGEQMNE